MTVAFGRWVHRAGLLLMILGGLTIVWGVVVWQWEDPFTALYTTYEQHELSSSYDHRAKSFHLEPVQHLLAPVRSDAVSKAARAARAEQAAQALIAAEKTAIRVDARRYQLASHEGSALGRIVVHRLGLNMIFLDGTDESSLERGPGRDLQTSMPGENRLVYIAGHRTTFLAPFSHIDALRAGDEITLELPYATFIYRVTRHVIVPATDLSVLRPGTQELLALQACHPRFFATHRYIVYARPMSITPKLKSALPYK